MTMSNTAPESPRTFGPLEQVANEFAALVPDILLFLGVLLGGVILASIARRVTRWLVRRSGLESLAERLGVAKMLYAVGFKSGLAQALGSLVWLGCVLFTVAACAEVAGLDVVASGVGILMSFLPRLLAAIAVMVGGISLATALRGLLRRLARARSDVDQPDLVAKAAYYLVATITGVMAADQAGLETELIGTLLTIAVGVGAATAGFAFATGARAAMGNMVAGHYLRRSFRTGDRIRSHGHTGVVERMTVAHTVVRSPEGDVHLPNSLVMNNEFVVTRQRDGVTST